MRRPEGNTSLLHVLDVLVYNAEAAELCDEGMLADDLRRVASQLRGVLVASGHWTLESVGLGGES